MPARNNFFTSFSSQTAKLWKNLQRNMRSVVLTAGVPSREHTGALTHVGPNLGQLAGAVASQRSTLSPTEPTTLATRAPQISAQSSQNPSAIGKSINFIASVPVIAAKLDQNTATNLSPETAIESEEKPKQRFQVLDTLEKYLLALKHGNCSPATIRNYKSDIKQFFDFTGEDNLKIILTKPKLTAFLKNQQAKGLQPATIKRKLISIAQFSLWAKRGKLLGNPELPSGLSQASEQELLTLIESHQVGSATSTSLGAKNTKPGKKPQADIVLPTLMTAAPLGKVGTIIPYLNLGLIALFLLGLGYFGFRQFQNVDQSLAFPTTLTRPNRVLSFQGRLTDQAENPIVAGTAMRFRLFDNVTGGTQLWDSNACTVDPDVDGIFNASLGAGSGGGSDDDDCGAEIPSSVFTENSNVWLQVTIGSETLSPRQPIRTVAYALNSETLQGFPASASAVENTVLIMNNSGEVVLGNANPQITSTGDSFTLEGEAITIQTTTGSNSDISLNSERDIIFDAGIGGSSGSLISRDYLSAPGATLSATYAGGTALTIKAGPSATGDIMRWQTDGGTTLGVINAGGDVGIGTNLPEQKLTVSDSIQLGVTDSTRYIYFDNGTGSNSGLRYNSSTDKMQFSHDGVTWSDLIDNTGVVTSVSNSDGTLTISPTTGAVVASLNLGNANTWTGLQTFNNTYTDFAQYLRHEGDTDTFIEFTPDVIDLNAGGKNVLSLDVLAPQDLVTIGDGTDIDTQILTDSSTVGLFVEGSSGRVGIGNSAPGSLFAVGSSSEFQVNSSGAIAAATGISSSGNITFSGLSGGTTDSVIIENSGLLQTRTIDSRVWGSSLVDGSGTTNYVTYWSDANTLAAEQYLATSRGGLGGDVTAAGAGELIYSTGTTSYDSLAAGNSGYILQSTGAGSPNWVDPSTVLSSYWSRTAQGILYPTTANDGVAATSSATTVLTATQQNGSLLAARLGGTTNYATFDANGNLGFTNAGGSTITSSAGLSIDGTGAVTLGGTNATSTTIGRAAVDTTINGSNVVLGAQANATNEAVRADRSLTFTQEGSGNVTITNSGSAQDLTADRSWTLGWTGQLSAARGGTGFGSYAVGDLLYADTTTSLAKLADVATGNVLLSGGVNTAPSWGKVDLTTHVSGILPIANGGTNSNAVLNNGRVMVSSGGSIVERAALSPTTLLVGNATTGLAPIAAGDGTSGQILVSGGPGVEPSWSSTLPSGTSISFTDITSGTNTTAAMVVGTGASLNFSGSGTINASTLLGGTWAVPGTIGSTTPNTGAFTTLSANATGNALTLSGAGANIAFTGAADAQIVTASNQDLLLNPAGTGNVGVNTTDPTLKLTIEGSSDSTSQLLLRSNRSAITGGEVVGGIDFATNDNEITAPGQTSAAIRALATGTHTASAFDTELAFFTTDGTTMGERLRIDDVGNVGIGDTTPSYLLDVAGDTRITGDVAIGSATPNTARALNIADTYTDANGYGIYNTTNVTGTLTGGRTNYGMFNTIVSSADNTSSSNTLYAAYNSVNNSNGTGYNTAYGSYNLVDNNDATLTNATSIGSLGYVTNDSTGTLTTAYGLEGQTINNSTGTITTARGTYGYVRNDTGTTGTAAGIYGYVQQNGTGGVINNAYGGYFNVTQSNGTIDSGYGVYIADIGGTAQYGLYQSSTSDTNYFAGNVGIRNTDPTHKLTIANSSDTENQLGLRSNRASITAGETVGGIDFISNDTSNTAPGLTTATIRALASATHTAGTLNTDIVFENANGTTVSEAMRIESGGNVGIGVTNPAYRLDVAGGDINFTGALRVNGDAGTSGFVLVSQGGSNPVWTDPASLGGVWNRSSQGIVYPTNVNDGVAATSSATTVLTATQQNSSLLAARIGGTTDATSVVITGDGELGIGTTNPQYKFQAHTTTTQSDLAITTDVNVGSSNTTQLSFVSDLNGTPAYSSIGQFNTADLKLSAVGNLVSPDVTILASNGNVGIGDASPASLLTVGSGDLFQVNSSGAIAAATGITSSGTITFSGLGAGSTDTVVTQSAGNVLQTRTIDSRVWGSSLVDGSGTTNYVTYWSDANTLAAEQYLATSRGGLGGNVTAAGAGEIIYSTGTTTYDSLASGTSGYLLQSTGAGAPTWVNPSAVFTNHWTRSAQGIVSPSVLNDGVAATSSATTVLTATQQNTSLLAARIGGTTDATSLVVGGDGEVGIGTITPAGKLDITDTSNTAASLSLTNNTATTIGAGANTLGVLDLQSTSLTTGNFLNIEANALTTGRGFNLTTTSTGLTSGGLLRVTASGDPAASWTGALGLIEYQTSTDADIDGDILRLGITGAGGGTGTTLNITNAQTGPSAFVLRVNDDGTYTDGTPFVITSAGSVGVGDTSPNSTFTVGSTSQFQVDSTGAIAAATGITSSGSISFTGLGAGTTDTVLIQSAGNVMQTRTIDSRVWGSSLVDGSGTTNYVTYWSDANTLAAEQYLATSRGGLGGNVTAAGAGEILYSTSTTAYDSLAAGTSSYVLRSNGAGAPSWVDVNTLVTNYWARSAQGIVSPSTLNDGVAATSSATTVLTATQQNTSLLAALIGGTSTANQVQIRGDGAVGVGVAANSTYKVDVNGDLRSSRYILGSGPDLSLIPVVGGQSVVTSWWGMQLVGNKQSTVSYTPANIGSAGDFSVIIPNQQAGAIGLVVQGAASQTGNLTEWRNSSLTGLSAIDASGNLGLGTVSPSGKLDIVDTSNTAASFELTNNTATTIGAGANTLGVLDLQSTSLTTGNFLNIETNALTTGRAFNLSSTSTAMTSASLFNVTASGSPAASWTGNLGLFEYQTSTDVDIDGSALKVGITGAGGGEGIALNVTTAQTGTNALALRVNDDGTYTDSTPFVVDEVGNVGVGTTTPPKALTVLRGGEGAGNVQLRLATSDSFWWDLGREQTTGNFQIIDTSANVRFHIDQANGNVGLDLTDPTNKLTIASTSDTENQLALRSNRSGIANGETVGGIEFISNDTSNSAPGIVTAMIEALATAGHTTTVLDTALAFSTVSGTTMTEVMRINDDNRVGIGTTAPARALHVSITTNAPPVRIQDSNGYCEINPTSTTWNCTSDIRLKKDISSLSNTNSLAVIDALNAVDFHWNRETSTDKKHFGFIAQEVETIIPSMVNTDETGIKTVDYGAFTPLLVSAIQAVNDKTDQLTQQVATTQLTLNQFGEINLSVNLPTAEAIVTDSQNNPINRYAAYTEAIIGKLQAGIISTRSLLAEVITATTATFDRTTTRSLQVTEDITARDITVTNEVTTNKLTTTTSKLGGLLAQTATVSGDLSVAGKTALGSLTATSLTVASDATISGNLTITGTASAAAGRIAYIESKLAQLETVKAQTAELTIATVSGTLYANNIADFDAKVAQTFRQPSLLANILNQDNLPTDLDLPATATNASELKQTLADLNLSDSDIVITPAALFIKDYFETNGNGFIAGNLGIGKQLVIGNGLVISQNSIAYQPATMDENTVFSIQPAGRGKLALLGGILQISEGGLVEISGDLWVAGDITTLGKVNSDGDVNTKGTLASNTIKPFNNDEALQVKVADQDSESGEVKRSRFEIVDELGTPVATISADGTAKFSSLSVDSENITATGSGTLNSSQAAGRAKLTAGQTEIIIKSERINSNSLIYVTPLSSTNNQVLYVKAQIAEDTATGAKEGEFRVGLDTPIGTDVEFNWWIVN